MLTKLRSTLGFNPLAWISNTIRMRILVGDVDLGCATSEDRLRCGVLVTPWLGTSVPWFSIAIGLLVAREGQNVTFILDDSAFGKNRLRFRFVLFCLRLVLARVARRHEVLVLSEVNTPNSPVAQDLEFVSKLAQLNTTWEFRGEADAKGRTEFFEVCVQQLKDAYAPIRAVLNDCDFELLFIPGGVWGTTGIWASCARDTNTRIGSFDSGGYGTAMLAVDGIACQLQDIPRAFTLINNEPDSEKSLAVARKEALNEMKRRRAGIDTFMSQIAGCEEIDNRYDGAIILALNSSWDSAALGLHTIFEDNTTWIVETVRFLLENTTAQVVVRQHPAERLEIARTTDDYELLLKHNFGTHSRLKFIAAHEKINSYDLLMRASALVAYTSTIGIEAAANLIPVITPSQSYYADLGFVFKATEIDQYKMLLIKASEKELSVTPDQKDNALTCYYLTQCCNWVFSSFNPSDFKEWSRRSLDALSMDAEVHKMVRSLVNNEPIAYLNHIERLNILSHPAKNSA